MCCRGVETFQNRLDRWKGFLPRFSWWVRGYSSGLMPRFVLWYAGDIQRAVREVARCAKANSLILADAVRGATNAAGVSAARRARALSILQRCSWSQAMGYGGCLGSQGVCRGMCLHNGEGESLSKFLMSCIYVMPGCCTTRNP